MTKPNPFLAVFLAAFVALIGVTLTGCGQVQATSPYGTSLFVITRWNSQAAPVSVLYVVGLVEGRDAFPATFRPEQIPPSPLSGPQTVRVLLADDIVGKAVEVTVYGYDRNGELRMTGTATSAPIVAADEVTLQVLLDQPFDGGPLEVPADDAGAVDAGVPDAGPPDSGALGDAGAGADAGPGVDAGPGPDGGAPDAGAPDGGAPDAGPVDAGAPRDAGVPDAGTPPTCNCATTCCTGKALTCAAPVKVVANAPTPLLVAGCGVAGGTCTAACDPLVSDTCQGGRCTCGNAVCKPGQRCAQGGGGPQCVCDSLSNCAGCCDNNTCVPPAARTNQLCGVGGQQCRGCSNQLCSPKGLCTDLTGIGVSLLCGAGNCHSADQCFPTGFPVCRATVPAAAICMACDPVRSDRCSGTGNECLCGLSGNCLPTEYCDRSNAAQVACRPLPF